MHNKRLPMGIVRLDKAFFETDTSAEIQAPRHVRDEIIRRVLDEIAARLGRLQNAPKTLTRLKEPDLAIRINLTGAKGGRQAGDAAPHNGYTPPLL